MVHDENIKLSIGALLHDIGKILYRYNDGRNHSKSGWEYLRNEIKIEDSDILEQIRFHHAVYLKQAKIEDNSLAYITYMADNISSATDRRTQDEGELGFDREMPLESIFNLLNGNDEKYYYLAQHLEEDINYPSPVSCGFNEEFYGKIVQHLQENLKSIHYTKEYLNSLLEILEADLSFIPSSTMKSEVGDISLYDHVKLTAAFAVCIAAYLKEKEISNYKQELLLNAKEFYGKKVFLLFSMDMSGIQDFIYTIASKNALKSLRSRSFYLEILMEDIIDELLELTGVSRTNLLYSGGGHAYMILPNTEETKRCVGKFEQSVNAWLCKQFHTALFIGFGYEECSAEELHNEPAGAYRKIFQSVSNQISAKKMHRYSAEQLADLNFGEIHESSRECKICRRTDSLNEESICHICSSLIQMSAGILYKGFFVVVREPGKNISLPMANGHFLISDTQKKLLDKIKEDSPNYVRTYVKNKAYSGVNVAKRLWVADYINGETFEELAEGSVGIKRIAVLRADVDDLGAAFVNGFASEKYGEKYMTISRTATFSRKMSMFFKYHINAILRSSEYYITDEREPGQRGITVVYSGGDDLFIVGSWDEVIGFAVDLHDALAEFSQNTLKISAGIGLFPGKYPVHTMAARTGELETAAKHYPGKNAVALFEENLTFSWDELINDVLETKLQFLKSFFSHFSQKGKAFLYRMLELIRNEEGEKINLARLAYMMARLEDEIKPEDKTEQNADIRFFSSTFYKWAKNEKDKKALVAAIYLYVYLNRESEQ